MIPVPANNKQPDIPQAFVDSRFARTDAVCDQKQPGRERDQSNQVQVSQAPQPAELEVQADHQQRRQVDPSRGVDRYVMGEDLLHT